MRWRSTTLRFALIVFLLQVLGGAAVLLVAGLTARAQVRAAAGIEASTLEQDLLVTHRDGGMAALVALVRERTRTAITPGAVMLVTDAAGRPLAGNLSDWPASVPLPAPLTFVTLFRTGHVAPEAMGVRATRLAGGGRLMTGGVVEGANRALALFAEAAALSLFLAVLFATLAAWLAARTIDQRLRFTVRALESARAGDLSSRVEPDDTGDAFSALAGEANRTLERVEALVGELKLGTDGLAHDLKSPLTRLRSALEQVSATAEGATADAATRALAESDRVLAMIETALRISRAEAGVGRDAFRPTSLAGELAAVAEIYGPIAEETGRAITVGALQDVVMPVHRELLGQALANLLDNTLRYGAGPITLTLEVRGDAAAIRVSDRGAGIALGRRQELRRRARSPRHRHRAGSATPRARALRPTRRSARTSGRGTRAVAGSGGRATARRVARAGGCAAGARRGADAGMTGVRPLRRHARNLFARATVCRDRWTIANRRSKVA